MSKKNKEFKRATYRMGDGSVVATLTANQKKGKLKGKNKKETKILKGACVHHIIGKNGKIKPMYHNDGNGRCICRMCGGSFPAKMFNEDKLDKVIGNMEDLNNQSKMVVQAIGADKSTIRFFSELGSMLKLYPKTYSNIRRIAEKQDSMKRKKKGNHNGGSNTTLGAWR